MKKIYLIIITAVTVGMMASCGSKNTSEKNADEEATELIDEDDDDDEAADELADGVDAAPEEDWTEEAVAEQIRKIYAGVNAAFAKQDNGSEANTDLFGKYCSEHWNEVMAQVRAKNNKLSDPSERRFENERMIWNYWGEGQVEPKDIHVLLTTGDMAEATLTLAHGDEWMHTKLWLFYEDGQWRINDWLEVGDSSEGLLGEMEKFVE